MTPFTSRWRPLWVVATIGALSAAGAASLTLFAPSPARCDEPALCRPQRTRLDDDGYLRAVSLDLRGVVPTPEEHERARTEGADALIDEWLRTPEFAERVVRRHRELLWPNISNVTRIYHFRRNLSQSGGLWLQTNAQTRAVYRGVNTARCLDEPASFDENGEIVTREVDGARLEGYVLVRPYWDPSIEIKVCAFDAQERRYSPSGNDCSTRAAINDPGCGCGPNLRWCGTSAVQRAVLESFAEELERRIVAHVEAEEPYYQLLTSRRAFVNGPIAYYWRHHRFNYNGVPLVPEALDVESLPKTDIETPDADALAFADRDEWVPIELPEEHAGLLTHPAYLLRFQTNRARASRFYDAFLCQPFQPPDGGIPVEDELAALQPDVQQRPGCNYCHAILEPAAAHWGRWTQQGAGYLSPDVYPAFRQDCYDCGRGLEACSDLCRNEYVTRALSVEEEPNLGWLRAYEFLRPEHEPNVEAGPAALVRQGLADGRFTACAVRRTVEHYLGRETTENEEAWVRELTQRFLGSDFRYRDLVRAVVTSETYRRAL
ncbi:MAG TPA: DUF1585 domain-containing protein [Sandaracinaceae bacterium]